MDNSVSTLSGLTKEQQIGQVDMISTVRSFLNPSGSAMDEVRNRGTKKDKSTHIVDTPGVHPI